MKMLRLFFALTILCGAAYPLAVTIYAQVFFTHKAEGSRIHHDGRLIGSALLAQKFTGPQFFHPRPSAADYATLSSGASQFAPVSKKLIAAVKERQQLTPRAEMDMWTTSGSGLDPHLSPASLKAQAPRVAAARGMEVQELEKLIDRYTEEPTLGIWGRPRVNVLELNIELTNQAQHGNTRSAAPKS